MIAPGKSVNCSEMSVNGNCLRRGWKFVVYDCTTSGSLTKYLLQLTGRFSLATSRYPLQGKAIRN